jgi:hypothetical protein
MSENQVEEKSDFELVNDLKPVAEMTPDEIRKEVAQANSEFLRSKGSLTK